MVETKKKNIAPNSCKLYHKKLFVFYDNSTTTHAETKKGHSNSNAHIIWLSISMRGVNACAIIFQLNRSYRFIKILIK